MYLDNSLDNSLNTTSMPLYRSLKPTASLIVVLIPLNTLSFADQEKSVMRKKLITYSFKTRIEICLNGYLKDIISHLLEDFLKREKHSIYATRVL